MDRPLTFVSWNIDGLARALPGAKKGGPPLAEYWRLFGEPDVLCLQEVRIRPEDTSLVASMEGALPGYLCGHHLCEDRVNVRFRGGRAYGVATYVRESLAPVWLEPPAWDREGRLRAFELPELGLLVANVYAVNGTAKPYIDTEVQPHREHGDRYAFKIRFQRQLMTYFEAHRARGRALVLLGDWNVSRSALDTAPRLRTEEPHTRARAMFNDELMPALELVDPFRELHGQTRKYTWFNRVAARYGRIDAARVDFALVSKELLPQIRSTDIAQEYALTLGSDHAPVSLALRRARDDVRSSSERGDVRRPPRPRP